MRRKHRVTVGTGGKDHLELAVRMHGNNAEFVPLALLMLLICELSGGSSMLLHIFGGSLLIARILHVIGLPRPAPNVPRVVGTGVTWLTIIGTSAYTLLLRFA
jgi:hypothetical protein